MKAITLLTALMGVVWHTCTAQTFQPNCLFAALSQSHSGFMGNTSANLNFASLNDHTVSLAAVDKTPEFEFVLTLLALIIIVLAAVRFLKNESESLKEQYYLVDNAKTLRLLLFSAVLMSPLLGYYRGLSELSIFDPFWIRIAASVVIAIPMILSFRNKFFLKHLNRLSIGLYYGLSFLLFFLLYKNKIAPGYYTDTVILLAAVPAIFQSFKQYAYYLSFFWVLALVTYNFTEVSLVDFNTYLISYGILSGVVFIALFAKVNGNNQLHLSNEIVNEVDALVIIADSKGDFVYVSNSIKGVLGYDKEEVFAPNWLLKIGYTEIRTQAIKKELSAIATGEKTLNSPSFQPIKTKSGKIKWLSWKVKRIEGDRVLGIAQDVSKTKTIIDKLKESENNFRQINETLSDVFYLYNTKEKNCEYISPACQQILGVPTDFFNDRSCTGIEYVHEEDKKLFSKLTDKINKGEAFDEEYRIIVLGEVKWVREKSEPVFNENEVNKSSGFCQDVTESKRIGEELLKLSLVTSFTSNYVLIAHFDHGIEWVNEAFMSKFGYTEEEALGRHPSDLLHAHNNDRSIIDEINRSVFEQCENFTGEIIHTTKSGKRIVARVDIIPIINQNDRVEKYFVLGVDITDERKNEVALKDSLGELKEKELALAYSEQNFRQLIKSIDEVFWLSDYKTREILFVSEKYEKMFGMSTESFRKKPTSWSERIHPEDAEAARIEYYEFAEDPRNKIFMKDFRLLDDKGETKWVRAKVFPICDENNEVVRLSGITMDVTEEKEKNLAIAQFNEQLEIIHEIENTILVSSSSDDIIYNTLKKVVSKLPILRASLALVDEINESYLAYTVMSGNQASLMDKREFSLNEFEDFRKMKKGRIYIVKDLTEKKVKTDLDKNLIEKGVALILMTPLFINNQLLGSFNVCFIDNDKDSMPYHIRIMQEIVQGLAIALQQSKLKEELDSKNKDITASINYAKMIQDAYIPRDLRMSGFEYDHFIYFKPKDIVSGDFYWATTVGDLKIMVVGDCTGHGVPGAFMTMIGINELQNIIINKQILDPAEILFNLNNSIIESLSNNTGKRLKDGMDVGICVYDKQKKNLKYAGAKRPLISIIDGELKSFKGSKLSIGEYADNGSFNTTIVPLGEENLFYIFSDGFSDQFGGPKHKKYMGKRTLSLIQQISSHPMEVQKQMVQNAHEEWKGTENQTDDIVFVGFKI